MLNFIANSAFVQFFAQAGGATCKNNSFFGLPSWHKYLPVTGESGNPCAKKLASLNDVWLIVLALTDLLFRIAIIVAIAFVIIGGIKFVTSQGNPDKTSQAKNTVVDALIGLVIAVIAAAVVGFIAARFKG